MTTDAIEILHRVFLWSATGLLILNLFQRSAQREGKGTRKRMASLLLAGLTLALSMAIRLAPRTPYPTAALGLAFAGFLLGLFLLRGRLSVYSFRCPGCGKLRSPADFLFADEALCGHWKDWKPKEEAVLCFLRDRSSDRVMLIHKKTGLGAGKVNAPGGRIEPGESARDAAIRETTEETGMVPHDPRPVARLSFQFADGYALRGMVFFAESWHGEMTDTPEADPFWCAEKDIPWERMWADDVLWLPRVLAGETVEGFFHFDGDRMVESFCNPVPEELLL